MITTANFIARDWAKKTQAVWCQDFPRKTPDLANTSSDFGDNLLRYFRKTGGFDPVVLKDYDFRQATAALVASVPGYHLGASIHQWGHMRLRGLLAKETFPSEYEKATVVCQYSSMGSLTENWLTKEFLPSLTAGQGFQPQYTGMRFVFPTVGMVRNSWEGYKGGSSVPVPKKNWKDFLRRINGQDTLCEWDGGSGVKGRSGGATGRGRSVPHIKTYTRFLPGSPHRLPWFLVTSANLSKAAWGELQNGATQLGIRSYELGLLFLPSLLKNAHALGFSLTPEAPLYKNVPASRPDSVVMVTTASPTEPADNTTGAGTELTAYIPVPYTLPPTKYPKDAVPWSVDGVYADPDMFGETWTHQDE